MRRGRSRCAAGPGRRRRCRARPAPPCPRQTRHHIDLGDAVRPALARHPERDEARPLLAVEDLADPPVAVRAQLGGHEGLHRVTADRLGRGHAEQRGGPAAPLLDQTVGADREGGHPDVVIDRAGRAVLPHDVTGRPDGVARCPRYFAHATVPSSSHTGPVLPAVFSTTAPTDTAFTITARSQSLSARFCPTSGDRCASLHSPNQGEPARTTRSCRSFRDGSPNGVRNKPRAGVRDHLRRRVPQCVRWVDPEADRRLPPSVPG
ncbi:hypothetical protein GA0115253_105373 [Streptomyces sp. Termitarium-T10T-6]|nr:hypothetical protein GA0115253_105373 [Streptomyces sp. Termitarium-T10T-6]